LLGKRKVYKYKTYTGRRRFSLPLAVIVILLFFSVSFVLLFNLSNLVKLIAGSDIAPPDQTVPQQNIEQPAPGNDTEIPKEPVVSQVNINGLYLPNEYLKDEESLYTFCRMAKEAGANSLILDIKQEDGILLLDMGLSYSFLGDITQENAMDIYKTASILKDEGFHIAARISCFKDNKAPRKNVSMAVTTNKVTWLDWNYVSYINPYSQLGIEYIDDLVLTAANAGFDDIILYNVSFPVRGKINLIDYSSQENSVSFKENTINSFLNTLKSRISPTSRLCLEVSSDEFVTRLDERTGMNIQKAIQYTDVLSPHIVPSEITTDKGKNITLAEKTITDPAAQPGAFVDAMCGLFADFKSQAGTDIQIIPFVQGYIPSNNGTEAAEEEFIAAQISALKSRGYQDYYIYHPEGDYQYLIQ